MNKLYFDYDPKIDGLRGIAVFAVIFYHANIILFNHTLFKGGFFGVDIFFVISGYLISSRIFKEFFLNNEFSFKNFYERRARRILPALIIVIFFSFISGFFILSPESMIDLSRSVISSLFFFSNTYFDFSLDSYFAENVLLKPLLHTWSLSVEAQFYFLFPILFLIVLKFFKKFFFNFLCIIFIVSLIFSIFLAKIDKNFNFYELTSRVFEFVSGTLISYFFFHNKNKNFLKINIKFLFNEILLFIGLAMIFF